MGRMTGIGGAGDGRTKSEPVPFSAQMEGNMVNYRAGVTCLIVCLILGSCDKGKPTGSTSRTETSQYPAATDPAQVGTYPALAKSGGGYFYDEVLEYRVWVHPAQGGDDSYRAFATYEDAMAFSRTAHGAEPPLVLVLQREWVDEPKPGTFVRKKGERLTEWRVEWLKDHRHRPDSIDRFLKDKQEAPTTGASAR
jgi:hypothetical protein